MPPPVVPITLPSTWIGVSTNFILTAVLLYFATRSLNDALERARRHERDLLAEIARRQRAEEKLHKSEALFRAISEQIPDSLFLLALDDPDVHVKIIYANEAASAMHGYPLEEILGRSIAFLNDSVTTEKMPERVERLLAGETLVFEGVHRRKDGTVFPVEVTSRMIDYGGRKVAVALDRDISERKRAEEALRLKVEQLDALNRASRAVTASLELNQVLAEIVSLASEMAAADYASVVLVDEFGRWPAVDGQRSPAGRPLFA
ncbi:MAG: PAS domain S-box protein [Anaerolineae bacterium]|nr:PAS domain S-box protein [Anaerolineae bacterium]MDH7475311.1 PAS domain S-box protein [Anaerolineae bacterium]